MYQIGETSKRLDLSVDTLRYYEKIGLLPRIHRKASGLRLFEEKDISRIKFIKRSQRMGFSLDEIKELLQFREAPQKARPDVRRLANKKLHDIETRLKDFKILQKELRVLIKRCTEDNGCCPILDAMDHEKS